MVHAPHNWHWYIHKRTDGVHALYANFFLRQLATNTFGIFIPLYLLKLAQNSLGGGVREGLMLIAAYYLTIRIIYILFTLPIANFIHLFGTRWSIFISNIFLVIYLISLSLAESDILFLGLAVLASALFLPFYFLSYSFLLASDSHKKNLGREVGTIHVLERIGMIIGPLLGGLITVNFGFPVLFATSTILVIISGIPPFFMKHHNHNHTINFNSIVNIFRDKRNQNIFLAIAADAVKGITEIALVPIFFFLVLKGYDKIGEFYSITGLLTIGVYWVIGWIYDKKGPEKLQKTGVIINSIVWWGRAFSFVPIVLYVFEILKRIANPILLITNDSIIYSWGHKDPLNFMVARNMLWGFTAGAWLLITGILFYFGVSLNIVFVLVGAIIWGYLYAIKKS